jgi:iron complex transport system permease protein
LASLPDPKWDAIIFLVRLPRVLGATVIGAALAVSGTVMQGLLRNPLADPGLIGVSSGAGFGAVLSIALGFAATSSWSLPVFASVGSLVATGIIFLLAIRAGKMGLFTLILAGMAVGALLLSPLADQTRVTVHNSAQGLYNSSRQGLF